MGLRCTPSMAVVHTSNSSSSVPSPPGSVMNASDRAIIRFFRLAMSSVTISSAALVSATSQSTSDCGITPRVCAPPERAPPATAPIMPTQPPPETRLCPRAASSAPVGGGRGSHFWSRVLEEAQKTQIAATSPLPVGFGQGRVGVHDDLYRLVHVVGHLDEFQVGFIDLATRRHRGGLPV